MDVMVYRTDGSVGMVRLRKENAWWLDGMGGVTEGAACLKGFAFSKRQDGSILGHVWES